MKWNSFLDFSEGEVQLRMSSLITIITTDQKNILWYSNGECYGTIKDNLCVREIGTETTFI